MDFANSFTQTEYSNMLNRIIKWAELPYITFNPATFKGIKGNYDLYGSFTTGQENAIKNVYFKWRVDRYFSASLYDDDDFYST